MSPAASERGARSTRRVKKVAPKYELFDEVSNGEHACHRPLPVNQVGVEYRLAEFVPLTSGKKLATLPRWKIFDRETLALLSKPALTNVLADVPLANAWSPLSETVKARLEDLTRAIDPVDFLANPRVKINGKTHRVSLTPTDAQLLLGGHSITLIASANGSRRRVNFVPEVASERRRLQPVLIDNLAEFLANPILPLTGSKLPLTPDNIHELATVGSSFLTTSLGAEKLTLHLAVRGADPTPAALDRALAGLTSIAPARPSSAVSIPPVAPPAGDALVVGPPPPYGKVDPLAAAQDASVPKAFQFALYIPYVQNWKLLGYSRGHMLNSIPLSPQEETTIEVSTWDRQTETRDESLTIESESSGEYGRAGTSSTEAVAETARTNEWHWDASLGINFFVSASASGGSAQAIADKARNTQRLLAETTAKTAERFHVTRQTKVSETHEFGSESRVTRRITNQNYVRTLTFDFFQVLETHEVTTSLEASGVRLCVLVENLFPSSIGHDFLLLHERALRPALIYPALSNCFDACRTVEEARIRDDVKCAYDCGCGPPALRGPERSGELEAWRDVFAGGEILARAVQTVRGVTVDTTTRRNEVAWQAAVQRFHRRLYRDAVEALAPDTWDALCMFADTFPVYSNPGLASASAGSLPRVVSAAVGPGALVVGPPPPFSHAGAAGRDGPDSQAILSGLWATDTLLCSVGPKVFRDLRTATFRSRGAISTIRRLGELARHGARNAWDLACSVSYDDGGIEAAFHRLNAAMRAYRHALAESDPQGPLDQRMAETRYALSPAEEASLAGLRKEMEEQLAYPLNNAAYINSQIAQLTAQLIQKKMVADKKPASDVVTSQSAQRQQLDSSATEDTTHRDELSVALANEAILLEHVQANAPYYRQIVWRSLDPADRTGMLSCLGSLLDFADDEVVGFIGDQAMLPFRLEENAELENWFNEVLATLRDNFKPDVETIDIPTPGIAIQPRLGTCDAAEAFVMDHRRLDVTLKKAEVKTADALAEQAKYEAERLKLRVEHKPKPLLDDPTPYGDGQPIRIVLDEPNRPKT